MSDDRDDEGRALTRNDRFVFGPLFILSLPALFFAVGAGLSLVVVVVVVVFVGATVFSVFSLVPGVRYRSPVYVFRHVVAFVLAVFVVWGVGLPVLSEARGNFDDEGGE